jgi:taurine--2-oxoglutarate transaminase
VDLQKDSRGTPMAGYNENSPVLAQFQKNLLNHGLFTFVRWGSFMNNPPLCITEEQLLEGFAIIDHCLAAVDDAFEG